MKHTLPFLGSYLIDEDPLAVLGSQVGLHSLQRERKANMNGSSQKLEAAKSCSMR